MRRKLVVDYLVYLMVRVFICIVQVIRIETGQVLTGHLAWLACDLLRLRGKVVEENLRHAFPEKSEQQRKQIARRMWEHLFLLTLEVAHVSRKIHETNWRHFIRVTDAHILVKTLLTNRPVIVVTGHFGNFEVGGYVLALFGFPSHSVARSLDNPFLNRFLNRFRGATGQHIIPKNGGYDQILEVLGSGGVMAFLADQAAGPKGFWVDFFGRPASTYKAIALLAFEHDAPVVVCYTRRLGRPMRFEVVTTAMADPRDFDNGVAGVRDLTQWYTHQLEAGIRRDPEQYWWVHRRWKETRSKRRKSGAKKAA